MSKKKDIVYTFHLAECRVDRTLKTLCCPPTRNQVRGLLHAECMAPMTLGSPIYSAQRMQLSKLVVFAAWKSASAIDDYLASTKLGRVLSNGWHVRMSYLRQWGRVKEFDKFLYSTGGVGNEEPVVAVTLARMKLPQVPRFIQWGKPVEELVRDHPGQTLALAAMRLPRTVSTFSVWKSQKYMLDMVSGHSKVPEPERHAVAMKERDRKDFHFEFTTLRFKPLEEHGCWQGRSKNLP